jgi:hypothetical protein
VKQPANAVNIHNEEQERKLVIAEKPEKNKTKTKKPSAPG